MLHIFKTKPKKKNIAIGFLSSMILGGSLFSITVFADTPKDLKNNTENIQKLETEIASKIEKDINSEDFSYYETQEEAQKALEQELEHKENNEKIKVLFKNENGEITEMIGMKNS